MVSTHFSLLGQTMKRPAPVGNADQSFAVSRDTARGQPAEALLRALAERTAGVTGREFFRSLAN